MDFFALAWFKTLQVGIWYMQCEIWKSPTNIGFEEMEFVFLLSLKLNTHLIIIIITITILYLDSRTNLIIIIIIIILYLDSRTYLITITFIIFVYFCLVLVWVTLLVVGVMTD